MYQFSSPFLAKCTSFIPHPPSRRIMEEYIPDLEVTCIFSKGYRRYLALCLTLCQFVSAFLYFVYVARCRTSLYRVARLVQIAPLNCWRNFTPFLCKASFCTVKTDHFRPELLTTRSCLFRFFYSRLFCV